MSETQKIRNIKLDTDTFRHKQFDTYTQTYLIHAITHTQLKAIYWTHTIKLIQNYTQNQSQTNTLIQLDTQI